MLASRECSLHAILTGNYAKELEEDYTVYDAISEVQGILGANEIKCNALKAQYSKYGYLWKRDLNETLKVTAVACIVLGATRAFVICAMTCTSLPLGVYSLPAISLAMHVWVCMDHAACSLSA